MFYLTILSAAKIT